MILTYRRPHTFTQWIRIMLQILGCVSLAGIMLVVINQTGRVPYRYARHSAPSSPIQHHFILPNNANKPQTTITGCSGAHRIAESPIASTSPVDCRWSPAFNHTQQNQFRVFTKPGHENHQSDSQHPPNFFLADPSILTSVLTPPTTHQFTSLTAYFHAYSAYLDDRPEADVAPAVVVRIHILATKPPAEIVCGFEGISVSPANRNNDTQISDGDPERRNSAVSIKRFNYHTSRFRKEQSRHWRHGSTSNPAHQIVTKKSNAIASSESKHPFSNQKSPGIMKSTHSRQPLPKIVATSANLYENTERHQTQFGTYIATCPIPPGLAVGCWGQLIQTVILALPMTPANKVRLHVLQPTPVALVSQRGDNRHLLDEASGYRSKMDPPGGYHYSYTVCVPPLFGTRYTAKHIAEFIEISRLFGAQQFRFYLLPDIGNETRALLNWYASREVVSLARWNMPIKPYQAWYNAQVLAIQDCLYYYALHRPSKRTLFQDVDELLVPNPQVGSTWDDLFLPLWSNNQSIAGFRISTKYFTFGKTNILPYTQAFTVQEGALDSLLTKCIVSPRTIYSMGIHHVSQVINTTHHLIANLPPSQATIVHYRKCRGVCFGQTKDTTLKRYNQLLRGRIRAVLDAAGLPW